MKRKLAPGDAAHAFCARRQDRWALMQHDVPAVSWLSASYSDPVRLDAFMENVYHRPADDASRVWSMAGWSTM
jgi:hypothetical protein